MRFARGMREMRSRISRFAVDERNCSVRLHPGYVAGPTVKADDASGAAMTVCAPVRAIVVLRQDWLLRLDVERGSSFLLPR
jgi:hypothetical protein